MKTKIILTLIVAALVLQGCGSTAVVGHTYPAVSTGSVEVLYQEPKRPYKVIAFVSELHGVEHPGADITSLREKAARLGADAVIITSAQDISVWEYAKAAGKAIKWTSKQ